MIYLLFLFACFYRLPNKIPQILSNIVSGYMRNSSFFFRFSTLTRLFIFIFFLYCRTLRFSSFFPIFSLWLTVMSQRLESRICMEGISSIIRMRAVVWESKTENKNTNLRVPMLSSRWMWMKWKHAITKRWSRVIFVCPSGYLV